MNLAALQPAVAAALAAHPQLAALEILQECAPAATAAELAAADDKFEQALLTRGLCLVVLSPYAATIDQARGGLSLRWLVPVALCENPEVNRAAADASAVPPRTPHGLAPAVLLEAAMAALLAAGFEFDPQPLGRPEFSAGFTGYYLLARTRHVVRAWSPPPP